MHSLNPTKDIDDKLSLSVLYQRAPSGRDPRLRVKVILHMCKTNNIYKHNTPKDYNNYVLCLYHCSFVWV